MGPASISAILVHGRQSEPCAGTVDRDRRTYRLQGWNNCVSYQASPTRYDTMPYRNCGHSGLKLPVLSLGLWQNFGASRDYASAMEILGHVFDAGITHFDLANNYGPAAARVRGAHGAGVGRGFAPPPRYELHTPRSREWRS